jgi:hypothetical protein
MRLRILILAALLSFTALYPASADEKTCKPDLVSASKLLTAAQAAFDKGDTKAGIAAVGDARAALQLIEADCTTQAGKTAGDTRTNPVPLGQRQKMKIGTKFTGSIEVTRSVDPANDMVKNADDKNPVPAENQRYVVVEFNFYCEVDPAKSCQFAPDDFAIVGSKGVAYPFQASQSKGFSRDQEVFGGGQTTVTLAYLVDAQETNFVLFNDGKKDKRVFFALQ